MEWVILIEEFMKWNWEYKLRCINLIECFIQVELFTQFFVHQFGYNGIKKCKS